MCHIHPIYAFFHWDCTSVQSFRAIGPLFMEILHFKDLGDTSVVSECSLGVNLVIDNFFMSFQILYLCIKFESNQTITYGDIAFWRFGGYECHWLVSCGYERSCSSARRVSNFNSKVTQGDIYLHIKFERDRLNIFRVRVLKSSRRTRTQMRTQMRMQMRLTRRRRC